MPLRTTAQSGGRRFQRSHPAADGKKSVSVWQDEAPHRLGLTDVIAGPLPETRNRLLVTHTYADMVMARMVAIACGGRRPCKQPHSQPV